MKSFQEYLNNKDKKEYKGYTFSFTTEYEDDKSYNFYTVTTPSREEVDDIETIAKDAGLEIHIRDDDKAFETVKDLIDKGKI